MDFSNLVIHRGIIQTFDAATWTATVRILPSQGNYLSSVQVAKNLAQAEINAGDECAILFFDELNPGDAIIIAVWTVPTAVPPAPSSGGSAPVINTVTSTVTINDTSNHDINTVTFTLGASGDVLIVATIEFKYGATNAGLHFAFYLDGTQIGPKGAPTDAALTVNQTTEPQEFTIAFYATMSAGAHTLILRVSEALIANTATIYWSQLAVKA